MSTIKKITTYPSTISWSKRGFDNMLAKHDDDAVIKVYTKLSIYVGSTTVGAVRYSHKETFTKSGVVKRIVVAGFERGSLV